MGKLAIICLGMALSSSIFAQSAANFDPALPVKVKPVAGAATSALKNEGGIDSIPSRLIGPEEIESYLKLVSSRFLMRNRERDPFGMTQNPETAVAVKPTIFGGVPVAAKKLVPFSEIVRLIVVTTVIPREKKFLIGSRAFTQGDLIPLSYKGKPLRVQITGVSGQQLSFRNLDTNETASLRLDLLPAGMTPGGQESVIPGMKPDRPNAPIELGAGDSAP